MLDAANMQGCRCKVYLFPTQITDFRCTQPMPKGEEGHQPIALALPIPAGALNQLLDFVSGEMLPGA